MYHYRVQYHLNTLTRGIKMEERFIEFWSYAEDEVDLTKESVSRICDFEGVTKQRFKVGSFEQL